MDRWPWASVRRTAAVLAVVFDSVIEAKGRVASSVVAELTVFGYVREEGWLVPSLAVEKVPSVAAPRVALVASLLAAARVVDTLAMEPRGRTPRDSHAMDPSPRVEVDDWERVVVVRVAVALKTHCCCCYWVFCREKRTLNVEEETVYCLNSRIGDRSVRRDRAASVEMDGAVAVCCSAHSFGLWR